MSMTREQIEANNARVSAEEALYAKLTPEERRNRMQAKALGNKSPIIMDAFKALGVAQNQKPFEKPIAALKANAVKGKGRQPNKTEGRFLAICEARKKRSEIVDYAFEPITFKLAPDLRYTPDVMIQESHERILFVEVKGAHTWEDARVKFLMARELHPWASWEMWVFEKGEWSQRY